MVVSEDSGVEWHPDIVLLPIPYVRDWFQESTWHAIATKGRKAGHPSFSKCTIFRLIQVRVEEGLGDGTYDITAEHYTYHELD